MPDGSNPTASTDPQGFPVRAFPYQPVPVSYHVVRLNIPSGEQRAFVLIFDEPSSRSVTFWTEADLKNLVAMLQAQLGGGLTLADERDLQALRDPSQIVT